jgi:hypothetical protein
MRPLYELRPLYFGIASELQDAPVCAIMRRPSMD